MNDAMDRAQQRRHGRWFWIGATAGWAIIAYGVRGVLEHHIDTRPAELARFVVGAALVHDLVVVPLVLVVGAVAGRAVRGRWRAPVQAGLIVSGVVVLFSYPLVRGYGRVHNNPSSLPRDYAIGVVVVLVATWAVIAVVGRRAQKQDGE